MVGFVSPCRRSPSVESSDDHNMLITLGLSEIARLGVALGADPVTFSGLAGLGDLLMTCASPIRRNHRVGADYRPSNVFGDINLVVIKAVRACNLRCPYCYYINPDTEDYGRFISEETLVLFFRAVADYLEGSETRNFEFVWHGGEPLLLGQKRFRRLIELQRSYLDSRRCINVVQSNGTLINAEWIQLFAELDIGVGISLDGPSHVHGRRRPKARGEGSHADVVRALELFRSEGQDIGVLCVIDPEANGAEIMAHFSDLGVPSCDFLLPMTNKVCLDPDFWQINRFSLGKMYSMTMNVHDSGFALEAVARRLTSFTTRHELTSIPSACQHCAVRSVCRGSHPASRYGDDGSFLHRSAYCEAMYRISEELLRCIVEQDLASSLIDPDLRRHLARERTVELDPEPTNRNTAPEK